MFFSGENATHVLHSYQLPHCVSRARFKPLQVETFKPQNFEAPEADLQADVGLRPVMQRFICAERISKWTHASTVVWCDSKSVGALPDAVVCRAYHLCFHGAKILYVGSWVTVFLTMSLSGDVCI
jgi:hypothetical protein